MIKTNKHQTKVPKLRFKEFSGDWQEKKLGDLMEFKNGINAGKESYGNGTKFINVLDILNNDYITYEKIIGKVNVSKSILSKNSVSYGDVLFQRSSETREEVGSASVYLDNEKTAVFGGFVIRGKKIGEYNPIFINKLLKTKSSRKEITARSGGSTRYNIGQETLTNIKLLFPSLIEQQKIADFLSNVDEKIDKIREMKKLMEEYNKGIIQKIFSQKIRFKDENGKDFDVWNNIKLNKIFQERKIYSIKGEDFPHISLTTEGVVPKNVRYERDFLVSKGEEKKYKITKMGDICYNPANLKFGVIARNKLGDGIFSPIYVTLEVIGKNDINFIDYFVTRKDFINKARKYEQGTVYERMAVSSTDLLKLSIETPSLVEQQKITDFLLNITEKIKQVNQELEEVEKFKKGLLQSMFV